MIQDKMKYQLIKKMLEVNGYKTIKSIGHGSFGEVLLIVDEEGQFYAAKVISKAFLRKKTYMQKYIAQQCEIMAQLNHPNIVRNYKCIKSNHFLVLINQYCNGGNLLKYQAKLPHKQFPLNFALRIISDLLKAIKAMHDLKFIHRDIKSENILVCKDEDSQNLRFKITDFGFARSICQSSAKTLCGTEKFMAPEILNHEPYGEGVDIWSIGVVLYFMLFAQFPFKGFDIKKQIQKKCRNKFQLSTDLKKIHNDQNIQDFFTRIFAIEKQKRIKLNQIPYHPLFSAQKTDLIKQMHLDLAKETTQQIENQISAEQQNLLLDDPYSEIEAQDMTCEFLKQKQRLRITEKQVERELEEIILQIDKIQYLKESSNAIFQTYREYFFYSQRIAASYYLLKASLLFGKPLLNSLEKLQIPQNLKQLNIEHHKWIACTLSVDYRHQVDRLKQLLIELQNKYEDTYFYVSRIISLIPINNFQQAFNENIQEKFEDIKLGYRSTTAHLFTKLYDIEQIDGKLKVKMQMRIFCCHMINRIFTQKAMKNLNHYKQWLSINNKQYSHSFDLVCFKQWIAYQSQQNLVQALKILIAKYF